ncbi:unnamed protein product [Schistosoma rodhaini]|nr:unnamed protein product [Schistosoma rodhaini]
MMLPRYVKDSTCSRVSPSNWSSIQHENEQLKCQLNEMNSFWEEKQKKLEDHCRLLSARLKYMKSKHSSVQHHKISWLKSSLNILVPLKKLKYHSRRKFKLNYRTKREIQQDFNHLSDCNQCQDVEGPRKNDNQLMTLNHDDNNQSDATSSELIMKQNLNNEPKLKLINNYKTSLIKSRKRAIQLLKAHNKLPHLTEIQCSYELLSQRNNSLLQQYQVMRKLKITAEQSNQELNNLVESLSSMLHRSRKQNIQAKRTIESIKMHLIKLQDTIKQLNMENNQITTVHQSENNTSSTLDNMNSKKFIKEFSDDIIHQLQEAINRKRIEHINMKNKIITLENETKRRRHYIEELRIRLQCVLAEQTDLRNDLLTKQKMNETLKLSEVQLKQTKQSQHIQLITLMNEKKNILENFHLLKQSHNHLMNELNQLKGNFLNLQKSKNENVSIETTENNTIKQTKKFNRICANDRIDHLEKFILILANELIKTIKTIYQLRNHSSMITHTINKKSELSSNYAISNDGNSKPSISQDSLQLAKMKAAEILCLSLNDLEKLTFLDQNSCHSDKQDVNIDNDIEDDDRVEEVNSFNDGTKHRNEHEKLSKSTIQSYLNNLSKWPIHCERLLKDFPFSKKLTEEFSMKLNDLIDIVSIFFCK